MKSFLFASIPVLIASSLMIARPDASGCPLIQAEHQMKHHATAPDSMGEPAFNDLPGYGKKCWIGDSLYFTYKFDKQPKMGTAILKVRVFDREGNRITRFDISGQSDMPSMRGAHDTGEHAFKLNRKGDYLLPITFVMPGEWEVKLLFFPGTEVIFRGRFTFEI